MSTVHQKLSVVIVLLALGGTLWAGYSAYHARVGGRLLGLGRLTAVLIAVQAVFGVILAASGSRPPDPLHFVFGPALLFALPVAEVLSRGRVPRSGALVLLFGWVIALVLGLRAVGTGGGLA